MLTRRDFIRTLGVVGAVILNPLRRFRWWQSMGVAQSDEPLGELYAGFVLLPAGAPWPPFIQCAPAPILGQLDNEYDPNVLAIRGETIWFDKLTELIEECA